MSSHARAKVNSKKMQSFNGVLFTMTSFFAKKSEKTIFLGEERNQKA